MVADIASLSTSLNWWEFWGYITLAAVVVGCAGEAIHEFFTRSRQWHWWNINGGKLSALILIVALAAELVTQIQTNNISGQVIAYLNLEAAGRRITKEQHDTIVVDLRTTSPKTFFIEAMEESEAGLYASDIVKTLKDAGWIDGGHEFPLGDIWTGLIIFRTHAPGAGELAAALQIARVHFSVGIDPHPRGERLVLMVGGKPPPF